MTGPGAGDTLRPVRTLRSLAFLVVGLLATTVGTGVLTSPAHGDDTLELKVRSGAVFAGRLTSADAAWLRLKSADGSEVRLAWKDLDERSWLTAKKATTPATDALLTMEPPPARSIARASCLSARSTPLTFTSNTRP